MPRYSLRTLLILLAVGPMVGLSCHRASAPPSKPVLSPQEARAVAAAETFVRQNGYVDQPADPKVVEWDIMERLSADSGKTQEAILERRRNTILGNAYGLMKGRRENESGWTVIFEHNPEFLKQLPKIEYPETLPKDVAESLDEETGRAVEVSEDFAEFHMTHQDIYLKAAEIVLRPHTKSAELK